MLTQVVSRISHKNRRQLNKIFKKKNYIFVFTGLVGEVIVPAGVVEGQLTFTAQVSLMKKKKKTRTAKNIEIL